MARPPEPGEFDWNRQQSGYTVEGEITDVGDFARGATRFGGWVRVAAIIVAVVIVLPFVIGGAMALVSWLS